MAGNARSRFNGDQIRLAAFAKALSHPARIAIVEHLSKREEATCGEIVEVMPLAQATVSQHLKELREAGLVRARECGPRVCYSVNCGELRRMCGHFRCAMEAMEGSGEG